ncbi:unnamed protein product, partial [Prunus brigantina]
MSCFLCCFLLSYKPKIAKLSPAQHYMIINITKISSEAPPHSNNTQIKQGRFHIELDLLQLCCQFSTYYSDAAA